MCVNPQVESMFGYTPEEAAGQELLEDHACTPTTGSGCWPRRPAASRPASRSGWSTGIYTKSGEVMWVRDQCVLVRDEAGKPLYWQGVVVDITEIRRALERSARRPGGCAPSTR